MPLGAWQKLFPEPDEWGKSPLPWFERSSELFADAWIAQSYGKYPWTYYAETTAKQRLLLRCYFSVKSERERLGYESQRKERE